MKIIQHKIKYITKISMNKIIKHSHKINHCKIELKYCKNKLLMNKIKT